MMAYDGIDQCINVREGEFAFWARFIQVSEIHADTDLPILLHNWDNAREPRRVLYGFDKPCFKKLHHFIFDFQLHVGLVESNALLHWSLIFNSMSGL